MTEPQVRLHDVSMTGNTGGRSAVLAAVERAVAAAVRDGTASPQELRAAISAAVSTGRKP